MIAVSDIAEQQAANALAQRRIEIAREAAEAAEAARKARAEAEAQR